MTISSKDWNDFIETLSKINKKASDKVLAYIGEHPLAMSEPAELSGLIDFCYGTVTKYGDMSATLTAEMFDRITELSGIRQDQAILADTATLDEVAKTVKDSLAKSKREDVLSSEMAKLVKMAGSDTMVQNAVRAGAEFAWIPSGDSCAFCIMLASRGWTRASKKAMRGGHAQHIHANCDCNYCVRYAPSTEVEGYDPDTYKRIYTEADSKDKLNSIRRSLYKDNADKINAQKREAYARRVELAKDL